MCAAPLANPQARNWVFTLNNPQSQLDWSEFSSMVSFITWQLELSESNTIHFQGYLECVGKKSLKQVKQIPGLEGAHFEVRCGTQQEAIRYANKIDTRVEGPWTCGQAKEQGKRSDLLDIQRRLDNGATANSVAESHFGSWVRYHKSFEKYSHLRQTGRNWPMEITVFIGPSGTGKTRTVHEHFGGPPNTYWKPAGKWWCGYLGQETVVLDEFYGSQMPFTFLLRLLDRYPLLVEPKGNTFVQFVSRRIVITSNQCPEDWYSDEATHQNDWASNPLNRRLREFARVVYTGEVHRRGPPLLVE